jgi:hypothetical protein
MVVGFVLHQLAIAETLYVRFEVLRHRSEREKNVRTRVVVVALGERLGRSFWFVVENAVR